MNIQISVLKHLDWYKDIESQAFHSIRDDKGLI